MFLGGHGRQWFPILLVVLALAGCENSGDVVPRLRVGSGNDAQPAGPAAVELVPMEATYHTGDTVVVNIAIDNAANVGSVPFHLRYDPAVLQFMPPGVEGPFLGSDGTFTIFLSSDTGAGGEIVVGASRLGSTTGADGQGVLATFSFEALTPGSCGFSFTGASVKTPDSEILPARFAATNVQVAAP